MKIIKKALVIILLFLSASNVIAQQKPKIFVVSPLNPSAGDTITITYFSDNTVLAKKDKVTAVIYLYENFQWNTDDLNLKKTDSIWTASFVLPKNCAFFACKFKADGNEDTGSNKISYGWMTTDKGTGKQMAGAYFAWGLLRNATLADEAPKYAVKEALITDEVMLYWIKQEISYHPESRLKVFYPAFRLLKKMGGEESLLKIRKELAFIQTQNNLDEKMLVQLQEVYKELLLDNQRADSVENMILAKYPKGITARDKAIYKLFREINAEKRDSLWKQYVVDFPLDQLRNIKTDITDLYYAKVYRSIIYNQIIAHNNYKTFEELLPTAPLGCLKDLHWHIIEIPLEKGLQTANFLLPYSTMIINRMSAVGMDKSIEESRYYSPIEWKSHSTEMFAKDYLVHALLLNQTGDYKKAFAVITKVKDIFNYRNSDFNGLYVDLLKKNNKQIEILSFIENAIRENALTSKMIGILKDEYIKKNKNEKGFDAYFNSLKSKEKIETQQKELKASLIKKEIASFKMESINGQYIDLSKQKGKIVVLDFWATWCGPCKAALPGMQFAVNKYKNDPNVAFYFIATQETLPNYRQVIKDYLKEKSYSMNVLYDGINPETKKLDETYSKYAKTIGFSGIPQKMIIDQNGFLRWRSTGYNGSPSGLADEISYIIELLKKEHN